MVAVALSDGNIGHILCSVPSPKRNSFYHEPDDNSCNLAFSKQSDNEYEYKSTIGYSYQKCKHKSNWKSCLEEHRSNSFQKLSNIGRISILMLLTHKYKLFIYEKLRKKKDVCSIWYLFTTYFSFVVLFLRRLAATPSQEHEYFFTTINKYKRTRTVIHHVKS
ncbi:hypothetical protein BDA99DRAFT_582119 [Phascolomyces articulosus]|uniref:Uncharacterized protein n=1 Tax=Phascolomyces articulosus TaxID=60185 RepID=A0AAD5PD96_9FUNG|nr:hypothetical protein BDA99DRAFT_582119 [Phascolomyces articulosus]